MDSSKTTNSIVNSIKEQTVLFQLPERLQGSYHFYDFLKQSSDKEIYQLSDDKDNSYILKRGTGRQFTQIKQEYQIFKQLEAIPKLAIPKCVEYWEDKEYCYLLRHYVEGCSLSEYFEKRMYFTNLEIVEYMLEICHIVQILHSQNPQIIHRDIKPENFILERGTGRVYLIDLDSARQFAPDKSRDTQLMGTPSHAAPEQFGFSQSDVRTDIYALGKTMLYLATGTTKDKNLSELSIAAPIRNIIEHCISFAPEQRYPDVHALTKALETCRRKLTSHTSSGIRIISACFILLVSATVGYILGGYNTDIKNLPSNKNNTASMDTNSVADTEDTLDDTNNSGIPQDTSDIENDSASSPDTTQNNSDSLNMDENSAEDSSETQSINTPLSEQTDNTPFDFYKYQDAANQIILDYYNEDVDNLALHCEALMTALYQEESLTRIPGIDYAGREVITKEERAESDTRWLRNCMAYRDQILYQRIGTYSQYKNYIFSALDDVLNPASYSPSEPDDSRTALYKYATLTGSDADTRFSSAFVDLVVCLRFAMDHIDSYPSPIEES